MLPSEDFLSIAVRTAMIAHAGQKDKGGQPYILHVLRVGAAGKTLDEQVVGFLHDVLEDTTYPRTTLRCIFSIKVMDAVDAITRAKDEMYRDYIIRLAKNPLAKAVKITDLRDNLRRLDSLPYSEAEGLLIRYRRALAQLGVEEI